MTTHYTLRVRTADGLQRLASLSNFMEAGSNSALQYVLNVGRVGVLQVTVPSFVDPAIFPLDARLSVWRSINGAPPVMDGNAVYLARIWEYGTDYTTVTAFHANELFARRIVAYGTWQAQAIKASAPADNQIKVLIDENMLAGAASGQRYGNIIQADLSAFLSRAASISIAPSIPVSAAWSVLADTIISLGNAATQAGTYTATEIIAPSETTLEARTYTTARGVDRSSTSASPLVFSEARGNLSEVKLTIDRSEEVTFALAGGAGAGVTRLAATSTDSPRMRESPLNRREVFLDLSNLADTAALQAQADAAIRAGKPITILEGVLTEQPSCTRGIHFDLGDIVVVKHRHLQLDMRLDVIQEKLESGRRQSYIQLRSVT